MEARDVLIYLNQKYQGNWSKVFNAIRNKEQVTEKQVNQMKDMITQTYNNPVIITLVDSDYPAKFKTIKKSPFVIYCYGNTKLLTHPSTKHLGIIGTSNPTDYGIRATAGVLLHMDHMAEAENVVIITTTSPGINELVLDKAGNFHRPCILILAQGYNTRTGISPEVESFKAKAKLGSDSGDYLIITEYPEDVKPTKDSYTRRNMLTGAICDGILVTELHEKEGSLIVNSASFHRREIIAVPNTIDSNTNNGCNSLIQQGAQILTCTKDIGDFIKDLKA